MYIAIVISIFRVKIMPSAELYPRTLPLEIERSFHSAAGFPFISVNKTFNPSFYCRLTIGYLRVQQVCGICTTLLLLCSAIMAAIIRAAICHLRTIIHVCIMSVLIGFTVSGSKRIFWDELEIKYKEQMSRQFRNCLEFNIYTIRSLNVIECMWLDD